MKQKKEEQKKQLKEELGQQVAMKRQ